jgi:ubiquinone/menaquinone biosynthesis C-methylase UbiE
VNDRSEPMYEAFARAFEDHAHDSAWNAHYDRPALLDLIGDVTGLQVLDAGCGPGFYAAEMVTRGAEVTAFDASPAMINLAQERLGDRVEFRVASLDAPLDWLSDATYDVALLALVLHHIDNRRAALAELHRVLKPGGHLVLSTTHPTSDWLHRGGSYFECEEVRETWQADWHVRYWRQPLQDWCAEFTDTGFLIERLVEPLPAESMTEQHPAVHEHLSTEPGFIAFRLVKPLP